MEGTNRVNLLDKDFHVEENNFYGLSVRKDDTQDRVNLHSQYNRSGPEHDRNGGILNTRIPS